MTINPEDFEAGANVTSRVRSEKSGGLVVSARLSPEDTERLLTLSDETGRTVSDLARQAIRTFLSRGGLPAAFALEISYGTPPGGVEASPRADAVSERETFAPVVLQEAV